MQQITYPTHADLVESEILSTMIFGTDNDPTQSPPTVEYSEKIIRIDKENVVCMKDADTLMGWSVVLPTSIQLKNLFLSRQITERELVDRATSSPQFEALYLFAVTVKPEYRRKGIGSALFARQIEYYSTSKGITSYYAYAFSLEGKKLIDSTSRDCKISIEVLERDHA
jgi:ribosomal protein S18 acetylase RimI-like enzyme